MSDEINKAILAKRTDEGKVERIHPETTADQVKYTNEKTVKQRLDELQDINGNLESRFEASMLKFAAIDAKFEEQNATIDEINNILDATEQDIADKIAEVHQAISDAEQELREDISDLDQTATAERERIETKINTANLAIESAKSDIVAVEEAIATHTSNIATIRQDISDLEYDIEVDITNIRDSLAQTESKASTNAANIANIVDNISDLEDDINTKFDSIIEDVAETEAKATANAANITTINQNISDLEDNIETEFNSVKTSLASTEAKATANAANIVDIVDDISDLEDNIETEFNSVKTSLASTEAKATANAANITTINQNISDLEDNIETEFSNIRDELEQAKDLISEEMAEKIEADVAALEQKVNQYKAAMDTMQETIEETEQAIDARVTAAHQSISDLESEVDTFKTSVSTTYATKKEREDGDALIMTKLTTEYTNTEDLSSTYATQSLVSQTSEEILDEVSQNYVNNATGETYATKAALKITSDKLDLEASKIATVTEDLSDYKTSNDAAVAAAQDAADDVLDKLTTEYTATADFSVAPDQIASTVSEAINTAKTYADGKVAQEVIDRNSAISQTASAIETSVAETYITSEAAANTYATQTSLKQTSDKLEVEAAKIVTVTEDLADYKETNDAAVAAAQDAADDVLDKLTTEYTATADFSVAPDQIASTVSESLNTAKTYADGKISQEVLDRNSAITQKADQILQTVSETYVSSEDAADTYATQTALNQTKDDIELAASQIYSTKTELDDALDSVSETYETKADFLVAKNAIESSVSENYTRATQYADGKVAQEVLDRNSAITQKADQILQTVSETYLSSDDAADTYATQTLLSQTKDTIELAASQTYSTKTELNSYKETNDAAVAAAQNAADDVLDKLTTEYTATADFSVAPSEIASVVSENLNTAKTYADGKVAQEITDRNSAITQKAGEILQTVSETYLSSDDAADTYATQTALSQTKDAIELSASQTYSTKTELNNYKTTNDAAVAAAQNAADDVLDKLTTEYTATADFSVAPSEIASTVSESLNTAKTYADGKISQEVTDRNSAITQKAGEILQTVSETYLSSDDAADTYATQTALSQTKDAIELAASQTYTTNTTFNNYKTSNDAAVAAAQNAADDVLTKLTTEYTATADFSVAPDQIASTVSESLNTAKTYADGKISQEVTDRNSAITQKANQILQTVSETYLSSDDAADTYATQTALNQTKDAIELAASQTYTTNTTFNNYKTSNDAAVSAAQNAADDVLDKLTTEYTATADFSVAPSEIASTVSESLNTAKTYADGKVAQEVTDRNSAITQKANEILQTVSETYVSSDDAAATYATQTSLNQTKDAIELSASQTYSTKTELNNYKNTNDAAVAALQSATDTNAQDLAAYILANNQELATIQSQVDGSIMTWFYPNEPTASNNPTKDWTTDALKNTHLGDLYYDTNTGYCYRYQLDNNTYGWSRVADTDIARALEAASTAQDTADNKRRVFVTTPTPPYDIGDLWVGGSTGDIKRCKTAKTTSQSYAAADWVLASKYTDDSAVTALANTVSETYETKADFLVAKNAIESSVSENYTRATQYTDGQISTEVTNRNSAITQKANEILQTVSETYVSSDDAAATYATQTSLNQTKDAIELSASQTYSTKTELNNYKTTNDAAVAAAEQNAKDYADDKIDDALDSVSETYETKADFTVAKNAIESSVSENYTRATQYADGKVAQEVTDRNSAITQKAGEILQTVSETYLSSEDAEDIYATQTALNQTKDAIELSASQTYSTKTELNNYKNTNDAAVAAAEQNAKDYADTAVSNLEIGGRNLIVLSQMNTNNGDFINTNGVITDKTPTSDDRGWSNQSKAQHVVTLSPGKYILSIYIDTATNASNAGYYIKNTTTNTVIRSAGGLTTSKFDIAGVKCIKFTITEESTIFIVVKIYDGAYRIKLEKGDKATDWTPAPEDVDAALNNAISNIAETYETKADFLVAKNAIESSVSENYTRATQYTDGQISTEVTNRNSAITQKANEILQTVSETYLSSEDAEDIYATQTSLSQTKDAIELAASQTYTTNTTFNNYKTSNDAAVAAAEQNAKDYADDAVDNLEIGGRNLLKASATAKSGASNNSYWWAWSITDNPLVANEDYTLSLDAKMSNGTDVFYISWAHANNTQEILADKIKTTSEYKRYSFTVKTTKTNINQIIITGAKNYNRGNENNTTGTLSVKNIKLEKGNKATAWTPAPEDADTALSNALTSISNTYETKADFLVAKNAIESSVSENLTTAKNYADGKVAQEVTDRNSAITQKANEILQTVSETYLSSDDAADTYATQTALSQTKDAIELAASQTYTTNTTFNNYKTSNDAAVAAAEQNAKDYADDAVDNLEIGGRNLILRSANLTDTNYWKCYNSRVTGGYDDPLGGKRAVLLTLTNASGYIVSTQNHSHFSTHYIHETGNHTLSVWLRADEECDTKINFRINNSTNNTVNAERLLVNLTTSWQLFTVTANVTAANTNNTGDVWFGIGTTTTPFYIALPKLEKGNKATAWTPAPEDADDALSNALTSISNTYETKADFLVAKNAIESSVSENLTTAKNYADGKVAQEVTDRNSAITQKANEILQTVSETYVNSEDAADTYATQTALNQTKDAIELAASQTYTKTTDFNSYKTTNDAAVTQATNYATKLYGISTTAIGTAAKAVTCADFKLFTGATVTVRFQNGNSVTGATTLNVNSTGAKPIVYQGATNKTPKFAANTTITFAYDGTNWRLTGDGSWQAATDASTAASNVLTKLTTEYTATSDFSVAPSEIASTVSESLNTAKEYADGVVSTEVTNRNSAITQKANEILQTVSETYLSSEDAEDTYATQTALSQTKDAIELAASQTYTTNTTFNNYKTSNDTAVANATAYATKLYGVSSTAIGTAAKAVTCDGFKLFTGATVTVKFTNGNSVTGATTLNVNSTGAKTIVYQGATNKTPKFAANTTVTFTYDGTYWRLVGDGQWKAATDAQSSADSVLTKLTTEYTATSDFSVAPSEIASVVSENLNTAKTYADGKIAQEVIDRNAAITQKAGEIELAASNTYTTKTEFNDLEIGGRNLLLKTADLSINPWKKESGITIAYDSTKGMYKITYSGSATSRFGIYQDLTLEPSQTYTLSCNMAGIDAGLGWNFQTSISGFPTARKVLTSADKIRYSISLDSTDTAYKCRIYLYVHLANGTKEAWFSYPKLEKGDKATDWTPAPEDIDSEFTSVKSSINVLSGEISSEVTAREEVNQALSELSTRVTQNSTDITTEIAARQANLAQLTEIIVGTQTSATPTWVGESDTITALTDGLHINYWLPVAGTSTSATLNLTLADGTTTGAIPCYYAGSTRITTHFPAGSMIGMTYRVNATVGSNTYTGWWSDGQYNTNSDTYDRNRWNNNITSAATLNKYSIIGGTASGFKTLASGVEINLEYPILYFSSSSDLAAAKTATTCYLMMPSVNLTNTKSDFTGVANKQVYVVGTLDGNTFTIDEDIFTCTVPATEDSKVYIPIGVLTNTTTCYFNSTGNIPYAYKDGKFAPVAGNAQRMVDNEIEARSTIIREFAGGVLIAKVGQTIAALVNANGSFDVVGVTWSGKTPTITDTLYARYGTATIIKNSSGDYIQLSGGNVTVSGTITGAAIQGGTVTGSTITGATIQGNNISGGTLDVGNTTKYIKWDGSNLSIKSDSLTIAGVNAATTTNVATAKQEAINAAAADATTKANAAQTYADTAVSNLEIGGRNLLLDSKKHANASSTAYNIVDFNFSEALVSEETYTISAYITTVDRTKIAFFFSGGSIPMVNWMDVVSNGKYTKTFTATSNMVSTSGIGYGYCRVYARPDTGGGDASVKWIKIEKGTKATDWTPAPEDIDANIDELQPELIVGTQTAATATWTGTSTRLNSITSGTHIQYKLPYAGNSNVTLNLTLSDGTTTGAKECYYVGTTRLAKQYAAGAIIDLIYDGAAWRVINPYTNTNDNTYDRTWYNGSPTAAEAIAKGQIIVGNANGTFNKLAANVAFDLTQPILYANAAINSGATSGSTYLSIPGVNLTTTLSGFSGTNHYIVYIVGTLSGTIFTPNSTVLTTTIPTSADNLYYLSLGQMTSTTNCVLLYNHEIYQFYNGAFKSASQIALEAASSAATANAAASAAQSTANANIKAVVTLFKLTNSTTLPSAPNAHVSENTDKTNTWTTAIPTWTSTYKYYYTCNEYQYGNGTYGWSAVVYDRERSEAMNTKYTLDGLSRIENGKVLIDGGNIYVNDTFTTNLFAKDITATGTIRGVNLIGSNITGGTMKIGNDEKYIEWDGNNLTLKSDTLQIGGVDAATTTDVTNAVDNLEIGGNNLLKGTAYLEPLGIYDEIRHYDTNSVANFTKTDNGLKVTCGTTSSTSCFEFPLAEHGSVQDGDTITLSFDYRGTAVNNTWYFVLESTPNVSYPNRTFNVSETEWQHYEETVVYHQPSGNTTKVRAILIAFNNTNNGKWIEIKDKSLMLEKGNKATSWKPALEDSIIEAGGYYNLLYDTDTATLYNITGPANRYWSSNGTTDVSPSIIAAENPPVDVSYASKYVVAEAKEDGSSRMMCWYQSLGISLVSGTKYTLSAYARVTSGETMTLRFQYGNNTYAHKDYDITNTNWKQYSWTFTYSSTIAGSSSSRIYVGVFPAYAGTMEICGYKLEKGSTATEYTPIQEDLLLKSKNQTIDSIEIGGRNLYAVCNQIDGYINSSNGTISSPTTVKERTSAYIPVSEGEHYILQIWVPSIGSSQKIWMAYQFYSDAAGTVVGSRVTKYGAAGAAYLAYTNITVPANATYIRVSYNQFEDGYCKLEKGNKATDWTPAPEDVDASISNLTNITDQTSEIIYGTQTSATATWTGKSEYLTELKNGTSILYWLPYAGAANVTLNLTLADGTTTGAKNCYYGGTTRLGNHYAAGNIIRLTYLENANIGTSTYTGWWSDANYNTNDNTYDRTRFNGAIKAGSTAIVAANIIVAGANNAGTYTHLKLGNAFDITYPILYAAGAIAANSTGTNNYVIIPFTVTTTQSISLTAYKSVYIKGTLSGSNFTPISTTPLTQTIPTSEDGYQYVYLGTATTATAMYLTQDHPIYQYYNGGFKSTTQIAVEAANAAYDNAQDLATYITSNDAALEEIQRQVDGSITTWFYEVEPTASNEPASSWTTTELKNTHLGDLYYNTTTGYCYRYQLSGTTYSWSKISDTDVSKALADAAKAQDTADKKRRVFVTTPVVPYDVGDLWVGGSTGDIKKCKTAKTSSQSYAAADWELASKYTDDTTANTAVGYATKLYADCATDAATAAKVATCSGFVLFTGATITVRFQKGNSVTTGTTLNVNSTGAKTIVYGGVSAAPKISTYANVSFTYDGTYWRLVSDAQWKAATDAQTTANANIKIATTLYYLSNSTTAPSKPSAHITQTGDVTGAWTTAIPTWTSTYRYYYTCTEYQNGAGIYSWSDVVYDRERSESMESKYTLDGLKKIDGNKVLIDGSKIYVDEAFANSIFAQNITATGTISGATINGAAITGGTMKIGSDSKYIEWNGNNLVIKSDTLQIGGVDAATTSDVTDAVDNLEIGGRNLLLNTLDLSGHYTSTSSSGGTWTFTDNGNVATLTATSKGWPVIHLSGTASVPYATNMDLLGNSTIITSAEIKFSSGSAGGLYITPIIYNSGRSRIWYPATSSDFMWTTLPTTWTKFVTGALTTDYTTWGGHDANTNQTVAGFGALIYWNGTGTIYIRNPKMEVGTKATDWTPAPEDVSAYTDTAKSSAISTAASDATSKANAAQAAAISAAATDATSKANAAKADAISTAAADATSKANAAKTAAQTYADNAVSNLEIGGKNLLKSTGSLVPDASVGGIRHYSGTIANLTKTTDGLKLTCTNSAGICFEFPLATNGSIKSGDSLVLSFDYRGTATNNSEYFILTATPNKSQSGLALTASETEWQHYEQHLTYEAPSGNTSDVRAILIAYNANNNGKWLEIKDKSLKLEKGDKATDWTPAPEDIDTDISAAQSTADSAMERANSAAISGLGIKWNYEKFSTSNNGEAYLCALDQSTNVMSDADGWIMFNGVKRTVTKGMINPNTMVPYNRTCYIVLRLSSATATTGTTYLVWYNSGWKSGNINASTSATVSAWTWANTTDAILGSFISPASDAAFVDCVQYTPVLTSQQVTSGNSAQLNAANAQSTANTANNTANANIKIATPLWYLSSSSTAPDPPGAHVSRSDDVANAWTTAIPTYSATNKYFYTCTEYQNGAGTYSWSDVVYDRSKSTLAGLSKIESGKVLIDGGNIYVNDTFTSNLFANDITLTHALMSNNYNGTTSAPINNTAGTIFKMDNGTLNIGGGKLKFDGSTLTVNGNITSTSGKISAFNFTDTKMYTNANQTKNSTDKAGIYLGSDGLNISGGTAAKTVYINTDGNMNIGGKLVWNGTNLTIAAQSVTIGGTAAATTTNVTDAVNNLEIGGRNLYAVCNQVNGYIASSGGTITGATSAGKERTSGYIPVSEGEHYILQSWVPSIGSSQKTWIAYQFYSNNTGTTVGTRPGKYGTAGETYLAYTNITVPANATYLRVSYSQFEDGYCKLEKGTKATDWTPAPEDVSAYTDDAKDAAQTYADNAVSNLEIGGRNMIHNSSLANDFNKLTNTGFTIGTVDDYKCAYATGATGTNKYLATASTNFNFVPEKNGIYTASVDVKLVNYVAGSTNPYCAIYGAGATIDGAWKTPAVLASSHGSKTNALTSLNNAGWTRFWVVFQYGNYNWPRLYPALYFRDCTGTIYFKNWKWEKGNKATEWSPAPEDTIINSTILYYLGPSTAPNKPTTHVTSVAQTATTWTTKMPLMTNITSTNMYFYRCIEYLYGDGSYSWSDVVRDENATALAGLAKIESGTVKIDGGSIYVTNAFATSIFAQSITATGTITGAKLKGSTIYTGNKSSATSTEAGVYIDSSGNIYAGAYNSSTGKTPFSVTSAGAITATSGSIGGFQIATENNAYLMRAEITASNTTYQYAFQAPDAGGTTSNAFYIRQKASSASNWTYNFKVRYDGYLYATKGKIAGFEIISDDPSNENSSGIFRNTVTVDNMDYQVFMQAPDPNATYNSSATSNCFAVRYRASNSSGGWDYPFKVKYTGTVTARNVVIENNMYMCENTDGYDNSNQKIFTYNMGLFQVVKETIFDKTVDFNKPVDFNDTYALFANKEIRIQWITQGSFDAPIIRGETNGEAYLGSGNYRWNYIYLTHAANVSSDKKLKDHIEYLSDDENLEDFFYGLKPVMYKLKDSYGRRNHMGLYAQDVSKTANETIGDLAAFEAAVIDKDENGEEVEWYYNSENDYDDSKLSWGLKYEEFIAPTIAIVQKQKKEINELKSEVSEMKNEIKELKDLIKELLNK